MKNSQRAEVVYIRKLLKAIDDGSLQLPQFQRQEAWAPKIIKKFLIALCKQRPLGVFLLVERSRANPSSQLKPRNFSDIRQPPADKAEKLLLDGQQRLTALWKVFNDGYPEQVYCIQFTPQAGAYCKEGIKIERVSKKTANNLRQAPLRRFCSAKSRKLIPLDLFSPQQDPEETKWKTEVKKWLSDEKLNKISQTEKESLEKALDEIQTCFYKAAAPQFLLPYTMEPKEVITTFMDINTGAKSLTHYDIAVADIEKEEHMYLEEKLAKDLKNAVPSIEQIDKNVAGELALKVACVLDKKPPSGSNYTKLKPYDKKIFKKKAVLSEGIEWAVRCLNELKIYRKQQLPSVVPLRVLPALYPEYKKYVGRGRGASTRKGEANKLIRRYIWHAFLTGRYVGTQINQKLLKDYEELKSYFEKSLKGKEDVIPAFKAKGINITQLQSSIEWPKADSLPARGVLMACIQGGGKDPASGDDISENTVGNMHYHHIFAKEKLEDIPNINYDLALNCLFISPPSNSDFKNHLPGEYLPNIWEGTKLDESDVRKHLETHLIDKELFDYLLTIKDETHGSNKDKLSRAYRKFIAMRAKLVAERIKRLLGHGEC